MSEPIDSSFIHLINTHIGIALKISRVYGQNTEEKEDLLQEMMYQLSRVKKHTDKAMQYFWSAFTLQLILYGILGHVLVRYGSKGDYMWTDWPKGR